MWTNFPFQSCLAWDQFDSQASTEQSHQHHSMAQSTVQGCSPPASVIGDKANQDESTMMDNPNPDQHTTRPATPPYDQQPATARYNAIPITIPVSVRAGDKSWASTAATATRSVTGMFGNIKRKYNVDPTVLGTGHYSSVCRCVDRNTGRSYAVKSIGKNASGVRLCSLHREIGLLQEMDHPSIIRLVDVFEDADYLHLVMDLCEGGELFERILSKSSADNGAACFPENEAARIIHQILVSVSYMHGLGIVHRDIKPENILFETADVDSPVKIIDFGLARKHLEGLKPPMAVIAGTPWYTAPEVLKRKYGKSCDLWSVGVVAYILLCGYPPFSGRNIAETHKAVLKGRYQFRSAHWRRVSFEARHFIHQMLQMDPKARMTTEQALNHPWLAKYRNRLVDDKK